MPRTVFVLATLSLVLAGCAPSPREQIPNFLREPPKQAPLIHKKGEPEKTIPKRGDKTDGKATDSGETAPVEQGSASEAAQ